MKDRVHDLAKEFGVSSQEMLAWLSELGEFVKSASSTVEAPVARRLRQLHHRSSGPRTGRVAPPPYERPMYANDGIPRKRPRPMGQTANNPFLVSPPPPLPPRFGHRPGRPGAPAAFEPLPKPKPKPKRNWYDGPDLNDLVLAIIRRDLVTNKDYRGKPPPHGRYFEDEVIAAKAIYAEWAEASFDLMMGADAGTETEVVVDWIDGGGVRLDPEEARAFHNAGIRPRELEWVEVGGQGTFRARFRFEGLTVAEVVDRIRLARLTRDD